MKTSDDDFDPVELRRAYFVQIEDRYDWLFPDPINPGEIPAKTSFSAGIASESDWWFKLGVYLNGSHVTMHNKEQYAATVAGQRYGKRIGIQKSL